MTKQPTLDPKMVHKVFVRLCVVSFALVYVCMSAVLMLGCWGCRIRFVVVDGVCIAVYVFVCVDAPLAHALFVLWIVFCIGLCALLVCFVLSCCR